MIIIPIFNKKPKKSGETEIQIYGGRTSAIDTYGTTTMAQKTTNLLTKLRNTYDVYDAIEILVDEHPDASMAYQMLLSLVSQSGTVEFVSRGRTSERIKEEWDEFASRVGKLCANGLEGVLYQLHSSDFIAGGMACEVVLTSDMSDIEDIYVINPKTIEWKLTEDKLSYYPVQKINGKEIDLRNANFLWVPFNPKIANPQGSLLFRPAISAADMQLEFFQSSQKVLYRVGSPRYNVTLNSEKVMDSAPPEIKNDTVGSQRNGYVNKIIDNVRASLAKIGPTRDIITTDDVKVDTVGGNNAAFFQGISAYAEIIDTQMMNALKILGTLMNRHQNGGSYALGTVEFKSICDMLEPRQRAEKRIVESIARIWLQVKGYNATMKYTPNPIEWQTFKDKVEYLLKNLELNRRADEYGYIDENVAAQKSMGVEQAAESKPNHYEYIKKVFGDGGNETNIEETDGEENAE